jgi:hypothetical protein
MSFGAFSYLISILIFAGGSVVVVLLLGYKELYSYKKLLAVMVIGGLLGAALGDSVALSWSAWAYTNSLHIEFLGAEIESYLFAVLWVINIGGLTLILAKADERGLSVPKTIRKRIIALVNKGKRITS